MIETSTGAHIRVEAMTGSETPDLAMIAIATKPGETGKAILLSRDELRTLIGDAVKVWGDLGEHAEPAA